MSRKIPFDDWLDQFDVTINSLEEELATMVGFQQRSSQPSGNTFQSIYESRRLIEEILLSGEKERRPLVFDLLAGHGNLAVYLARDHDVDIIAVDKSFRNMRGINKRARDYALEEIRTKRLNLLKHSFVKAVGPEEMSQRDYGVLSMHCCGSLADVIIKQILQQDRYKPKMVGLLPCCYYKTEPQLLLDNYVTSEDSAFASVDGAAKFACLAMGMNLSASAHHLRGVTGEQRSLLFGRLGKAKDLIDYMRVKGLENDGYAVRTVTIIDDASSFRMIQASSGGFRQ